MRKAFLLLLVLLPVSGFGSVVYTFSDRQFDQGSFGFSMTTPDWLQVNDRGFYSFTAGQLTLCDTTANPSYTCAGGSFLLSSGAVDVVMALSDPKQTGPGSTDEVDVAFVGASLTREGTTIGLYPGAGDKVATFTVQQFADPAAAPEPGTLLTLALGSAAVLVVRKRRSRFGS